MKRLLTITGTALAAGAFAAGSAAGAGHHAARPHAGAATVSGLDEQYLETSISGDRFEIAGGKIALAKSPNASVRALASRLVTDHTKSLRDAVKLAKRLGVKVPGSPTPPQQWELRIVSTEGGRAFDQWYSYLEVGDHQQDIQDASSEASNGSNPSVRRNARQELPTLRKHLKLAQSALNASGGRP